MIIKILVKIILNLLKSKLILVVILIIQLDTLVQAQSDINLENSTSATVEKIVVKGHTVFSDIEIKKTIKPFLGKKLDFNQLRNISEIITNLYLSNGYITSGAFIPEQEIVDGIVTIQVIEGKLEKLDITGTERLQENYVRSFISFASKHSPPLNIKKIEEELNLLKRDSSIASIEAELVKGIEANSSVLLLEIKEKPPFEVKLSFDNYRSPSIGEFQGTLETGYRNLIGVSDRVFAQYNLTEGFDAYSIGYGIPIFFNKGTVNLEYRNGDSKIIEDIFEAVNIRAESDTFLLQYRQPIIYKANREIALGLGFERKNSETFILDDEPFSFTDGPQQGKSVVSVLKLTSDWVERSSSSVLGISSELNFGLDAFDATINNNAPDGLFFSWQAQAQWTKALNQDKDFLLVTRLTTQLSPDSLLPLEEFTLGGRDTVRGYRQNQEVGDNAFVGTVEVYIPLVGDRISSSKLNLVPFFDGGTVWDSDSDESQALASVGLGLDWQFKEFLSLRVDWGVPLINSDHRDSLQDNGFSFSVEISQ